MEVGPYEVAVVEIPGGSLSVHEWRDVQLARLSYARMWGGRCVAFDDDPLDGRGEHAAVYDARHYLAWVRDGQSGAKLLATRKVALRPLALTPELRAAPGDLLPLDLRFWKVTTPEREAPLWEAIRAHARSLAPADQHAEFRVKSISRIATFPCGEREDSARLCERTAVAFAATLLLAADDDGCLLLVCSLCAELRDRVMTVHDVNGHGVRPSFTPIEDTLGLPAGSVRLDNDAPVVQQHKIGAPGYFVDNADAASVLEQMLDEGAVTIADLRPSIARLIEAESAIGRVGRQLEELLALMSSPDHWRLAAVLTRPRLFKYAVPMLAGADPLAPTLLADLRRRLLYETGDGPFSAAVSPATWSDDALSMLLAVDGKYPRRNR